MFLQKLIKCILERWRVIDNKGNFQEQIAVDVLSEGEDRAKYEAIAEQCRPAADENKDEMPIKLFACYTKLMKESN